MMEYHNNSPTRHNWKSHLTFHNNETWFSGIYCECGAYIEADELSGIISFYSANDIASGVIEDKIMHRSFDAKAYEERMK